MDNIVIRAQELTKQFGSQIAIQDVTFEISRGRIFGFIGPSGSGKTTTIRLLTGVYEPTAGEAVVLGEHPVDFTQSTRARIGYMPQLFVLYRDLTVWENLNFAASIYGMSPWRGKRLKQLLDFVELSEHRRKLARTHPTPGFRLLHTLRDCIVAAAPRRYFCRPLHCARALGRHARIISRLAYLSSRDAAGQISELFALQWLVGDGPYFTSDVRIRDAHVRHLA